MPVLRKAKNTFHLATGLFWNLVYAFPSRTIKVIGVTGTDGKTTTARMIYEILRADGRKAGLISTLGALVDGREVPVGAHVTTPGPRRLQRLFREMKMAGLDHAVVETSSHAIDQHRDAGVRYEGAVYTNITHEHLDYHGTFEKYLLAKAKLLNRLKESGFCIINRDDPSCRELQDHALQKRLNLATYSLHDPAAGYLATGEKSTARGSTFGVKTRPPSPEFDVTLFLPGRYNMSNAMAAISCTLRLGVNPSAVQQALSRLEVLPGRWEILQEAPFGVIVDFAHSPNALGQALTVARRQAGRHRLILVLGSAGRRDKAKRHLMGEVAAGLADSIILTSEDPRGEPVEAICQAIAHGVIAGGKTEGEDGYRVIPDRKEAIFKALQIARENDLVLITGKGHETTMNLDGRTETPWSDQQVVRELLLKLGMDTAVGPPPTGAA